MRIPLTYLIENQNGLQIVIIIKISPITMQFILSRTKISLLNAITQLFLSLHRKLQIRSLPQQPLQRLVEPSTSASRLATL